jgi:MinD superfamily P-loop ATPase
MKIAVASGKGGTGKTFVSTNLFQALQKSGKVVALVDCDAEEPNAAEFISGHEINRKMVLQHIPVIDTSQCQFCGKCFEYCEYHAIVFLPTANLIEVIEDLCHDCGACSYACQYGAITESEKPLGVIKTFQVNDHSSLIEARTNIGIYSSVPVVKKAIKETEGQPLVLLDAPPGISCPFIATVGFADYVVLVTEPTPFGLNDLKLSVETVQQLGKPFGVIVNRAGLGDKTVYDWLEQNNIPLLMEIPFDVRIARIYSEGRLLVDADDIYMERFMNLYKTIRNGSFGQ